MFEAGYGIRLVLASSQPGYLYVVNEGAESTADKPDVSAFFPDPRIRSGSAQLQPGQELNIPQGDFLVLDKQKGKEKLWLVWSQNQVPLFEGLKKWVNPKDRGAIGDAGQAGEVGAYLQKAAASAGRVTAEPDAMNQMTILKSPDEVLVRRIVLEHD